MKLCLICNFQTAEEQDLCPRDGSAMVTVGDDPLLGMVVEGRYKIESVIGQGSAGTVYKAVQELIGREVAIKVLHDYLVSDQEFIRRFKQEAKASSKLTHPNIITIYDFGVIPKGGRPYIAMDLLRGTPLSDMIQEEGCITGEESVPLFKQVCGALGEAHRQGIVHRDVKPENIVLVERSGQKRFPIVVDFGIARLVQEESDVAKITRTGTVCGSPTYMSPEQCTSSKVDHRSDIYSLGVVIYETLTGEVPFMSDELVKVMAMHLSDAPKPLNQVRSDLRFPDRLEQIVAKALAKNPDHRFQNMEEFSEALDEALKEPEKPAYVPPPPPPPAHIPAGPLASSEDLNRRKESREFVGQQVSSPSAVDNMAFQTHPPTSSQMPDPAQSGVYRASLDGANKEKLSNTELEQLKSLTATKEKATPLPISEQELERIQARKDSLKVSPPPGTGSGKKVAVIVALVAVIAGGFVISSAGGPLLSLINKKEVTYADAENMIRDGKLEEACDVLTKMKQDGKLSSKEIETLYKVDISLAKQYVHEGRTADAVKLLNQVGPKSTQADAAKAMLVKLVPPAPVNPKDKTTNSGSAKKPVSSGKRGKRQTG